MVSGVDIDIVEIASGSESETAHDDIVNEKTNSRTRGREADLPPTAKNTNEENDLALHQTSIRNPLQPPTPILIH